MDIVRSNNVQCFGKGAATLLFAHGFGCDQSMWRFLTPHVESRYKIVLYDLAGCGYADPRAYDRDKYATLQGHATDVLDIVTQCCTGPVILVGHAVGAMIGMLATIRMPARFAGQVMLGPSPCYVNDGAYVGGFNQEDLEQLLQLMHHRYDEWAALAAPLLVGARVQPELRAELEERLRRHDRDIMRHFARVAFLSDVRADVARSSVPALILQCSDDLIAPTEVGDYLHRHLSHSTLVRVDHVGHCPHMSAPSVSVQAMEAFLRTL
ncbi:MAG: alpha/beta hydrolase [Telluria sp.]